MIGAGKGTYEGTKGTDLIEEKIDEVILRALGLEDVFDLDYDTYKTLLKERMMADRMGQKMDSGEAGAVTEEYKRVKTKVGRFRLVSKKIKTDFLRPKTKTGSTAPIKDVTKLIPGSSFADVEKPQQIMLPPKKEISKVEKEPKVNTKKVTKKKKSLTDAFSKIQSVLDDIGKSLKNAFSFEKETDKKKTQEEGRKKKKQKESALEKTVGAIAKIGKKILEPLKGPLDYIINWITYTFLGKVFNNLLNWMSDPGNSKKMMSIGRFLKDWWPALVGAYLIFGNSLGRFVSKLIFTIGAFSVKMLKTAIPALLNVIRKNPLAAGALLFTAGATIPMMFPDTVDEQEKKTDKAIKEKGKDKVKSELERKANNPNFFERLTGQDAEAKEQLYKTETGETKPYGFRKGGKVTTTSGTDIKGAGVDTQLIAARPGEVVINKETVNALGAPFFLSLNKKYGGSGANKPKMAKGVQTASSGGLVLPAFSSGGQVGGETPAGGTYMSNGGRSENGSLSNIKNFIKQKIGYDVDKPETWGASFSSVFADKSSGSKPPKSKGKGFDFIATAQGLANQGMGLAKSATDPRSYQGLANQGQGLVNRGGGFKMPNLPSGGGMPGGLNPEKYIPEKYRGDYNRAKETVGGGLNPEKYIPEKYRGDYNRAKETVGGVINKGKEFVGGIRQNVINEGYLSKRGFYEGAAKAQGNNFLSELLPNLPGVSAVNKAITEEKLTKMGLGRDSNNIFINKEGKKENFTTAFYGGSSGIDRSHNVGQAQVNKMSEESRKYYLKKVKAGLRDGTLKSGELINAYDLDAKNPIRREQGTVRFFVGPDGSPYLTDTYGFDPGQVDLASEQAKYDQQVKEFRDPKTMMGRMSKMLGLKPLADATEGGSKVQFALALRNKIFGYDPEDEAKAKLGMRFKTKVQIEELRKNMTSEEIDQLLKLSKDQLSLNERTALEKVKKKNQKESKKKPTSENQKKLEAKRPFYDPFGMFGGASAEIQRKKSNPYTAPGGIGPTISRPSKPNSRGLSNIPPSEGTRRGGPSDIVPKSNQQRLEEKRPWWDKFGMFGGASAQVKKKQGGGVVGMQGGGVLDTLGGLGVPGTGTVMSPLTYGPKDLRGNRQTDPGFQSKFMGMNLGKRTSGPAHSGQFSDPAAYGGVQGGYSDIQKKRYMGMTGGKFAPTSYQGQEYFNRHLKYPGLPSLQNKKIEIPDYMMPSNTSKSQQPQSGSRSENDKLIGESFKNFGKNVQTLRDVSKKQEEMMRELGYKPDGYMNLGGRPMKKQGGGINESSGMNIPGAAADRQLIATQPGEYVLPVDAVMKMGGVHKIDQLVASLDSNSNAAKMLGTRKPIPGPPSAAGRSGMMTLPPITGGSGSSGGGGSSGRKQIPNFSATSPYTGERKNNADIYGIK